MGILSPRLSLILATLERLGYRSIDGNGLTADEYSARYVDHRTNLNVIAFEHRGVSILSVKRPVSDGYSRCVQVQDGPWIYLFKYTRMDHRVNDQQGWAAFFPTAAEGASPSNSGFILRSTEIEGVRTETMVTPEGKRGANLVREEKVGAEVTEKAQKVLTRIREGAEHVEFDGVYSVPRAPQGLDVRHIHRRPRIIADLAVRAADHLRGPLEGLNSWGSGFFKLGAFALLFFSASVFLNEAASFNPITDRFSEEILKGNSPRPDGNLLLRVKQC
ncbi:MAG: hypothetical protein HYT76_02310 [Deltaproteobacteria bacterium]|nr:hypothetical protein [Deltaproteobacteria bacterium]